MKRTNELAACAGFVLKLLAMLGMLVITIGGLLAVAGSMLVAAIAGSLILWHLLKSGRGRLLSALLSSVIAAVLTVACTYAFSSMQAPIFFFGDDSYRDTANLGMLAAFVFVTFLLSECVAVALAPKRA